jgi:hypothetical protein
MGICGHHKNSETLSLAHHLRSPDLNTLNCGARKEKKL